MKKQANAPAADEVTTTTTAPHEEVAIAELEDRRHPAVKVLDEVLEIARNAPSDQRQSFMITGNKRYDSGNVRAGANGRAVPVYYPYIFAKKIYPNPNASIKDKIAFIRGQMGNGEPNIDLLGADAAKLCLDCGIRLPEHLHPEAIRNTLLGKSNDNEEQDSDNDGLF